MEQHLGGLAVTHLLMEVIRHFDHRRGLTPSGYPALDIQEGGREASTILNSTKKWQLVTILCSSHQKKGYQGEDQRI